MTITPGIQLTAGQKLTRARANLLGTPTVTLDDGEVTPAKLAASALALISGKVTTIAALKALVVTGLTNNTVIQVLGYSVAGDGGGGLFYYDNAAATADNGGTVIAPTVGTGRWLRSDTSQPSILWFGCDPTNTLNNVIPFNLSLAYMRGRGTNFGGVLRAPQGTYKFNSKPDAITTGITIAGEGKAKSYFFRNYNEATATVGFLDLSISGGFGNGSGGVRDLGIYADGATTGGAAISVASSLAVSNGQLSFTNLYVSGTGTWNYCFYADGTAKVGAPIGVRGVYIADCDFFQSTTEGVYLSGVLHGKLTSLGIYSTGAANQGLTITGTAAVPSENINVNLGFCDCIRIGPVGGYATRIAIVAAGTVTDLTTGANASYWGVSASYLVAHSNASSAGTYTLISGGGVASVFPVNVSAPKFLANGAAGNYPIESLGGISGYTAVSATVQAGMVGATYVTQCPNGQTFTFSPSSAKLFHIATGGGAAALIFADYKQTTIVILSDPSAEFQASAAPAAGKTGIFKAVNAHAISVINNTGGAANYSLLAVGLLNGLTAPV